MAVFLASLAVEISADTHEEAARIFQGAMAEYAMLEGMSYDVRGIAPGAERETIEAIELPPLAAEKREAV